MRGRRSIATEIARGGAWLGGALLVLFLGLPLVLVLVEGASGLRGALHDSELIASLAVTFASATIATLIAVLCGSAIAFALARRTLRAGSVIATVLDVPLLLPHPVAGIAILLLATHGTVIGESLSALGMRVVGTPTGIIAAMLFVSAPIYVSAAREAFSRVDVHYEIIARSLGDSSWSAFRRVTLPLARRGLLSAAIVTWARAISEFGAVVVLVYNPKVVSVLSYERLTDGGLAAALPVAAALVIVSILPLAALRALHGDRSTGVLP